MSKKKLYRSEDRLKKVLEGSEEGFWDWDIVTGIVTRNDRWAQILGYSSISEFRANTDSWTDNIHIDDREKAWKSIQDHLDGKTDSHNIEYRMRTESGEYIWVLDHARIVERDRKGNPVRMSGTHRDITERKKLEEERDVLFHQLQSAMDEISELKGIISVCSSCHKILDNDETWQKIESYLEIHTNAQFSHGLCRDCIKSLYGDEPWYKESE